MQIPVQVTFRDVPVSDAVEAACLKEAEKLDRYYDRITSCRVVVETPSNRRTKGDLYSISIDITVPGAELVVNRDHGDEHGREDVYVAIRDAFDRARRQLEEYAHKQRGQVKHREERG